MASASSHVVLDERPVLREIPSQAASAAPVGSARADAGPQRYAFDFEDAELPELVRAISTITGKRLMLTGQLPKVKATVHSPTPVTAEEAYSAFLTILADNGLTVVRHGAFETIVTQASLLNR